MVLKLGATASSLAWILQFDRGLLRIIGAGDAGVDSKLFEVHLDFSSANDGVEDELDIAVFCHIELLLLAVDNGGPNYEGSRLKRMSMKGGTSGKRLRVHKFQDGDLGTCCTVHCSGDGPSLVRLICSSSSSLSAKSLDSDRCKPAFLSS